jgi:predicted nucleotidyltransferase
MPRLKHSKRYLREVETKRSELFARAVNACEFLLSLGAEEVFIFGSLVRDDFREHSDVDLAVSGLPYEHVYKVESRIEDILGGATFDLVYMEHAPEYIIAGIRSGGRRYVARIS